LVIPHAELSSLSEDSDNNTVLYKYIIYQPSDFKVSIDNSWDIFSNIVTFPPFVSLRLKRPHNNKAVNKLSIDGNY